MIFRFKLNNGWFNYSIFHKWTRTQNGLHNHSIVFEWAKRNKEWKKENENQKRGKTRCPLENELKSCATKYECTSSNYIKTPIKLMAIKNGPQSLVFRERGRGGKKEMKNRIMLLWRECSVVASQHDFSDQKFNELSSFLFLNNSKAQATPQKWKVCMVFPRRVPGHMCHV